MKMSLKHITINTFAMSSVGLFRILSQIVAIPITARYLSPHDYGLMATAMPFIVFSMIISDAGISSSLIRSKSIAVSEWSSNHWFITLIGIILASLMCCIGYLMSIYFEENSLFLIICALSISIFLQCVTTTPGAALQNKHKYSTIAIIEIISIMLGLLTAIGGVINEYGVWSLVGQQVVMFSIKFILTTATSPFFPKLYFQIADVKKHLSFGVNLVGGSFLNLIKQSLSNTVIVKVLDTQNLGMYSMATLIIDLPQKIISGPLQTVLYPRISRHKENHNALRIFFIFGSRILAILITPLFGLIAAANQTIFHILLSEKWAQAGQLFLLASPLAILAAVTSLRATILMAVDRTDILLKQSFYNALATILAVFICSRYDISTVALGACITGFILCLLYVNNFCAMIDLRAKVYYSAIIAPAVFTILASLTFISFEGEMNTVFEKLIYAIILGFFTLLASILVQIKSIKQEAMDLQKIL